MEKQPDADDSLVGSVLDGRYRIERILGVGGMGAVYQAVHELLGTALAVKVMRSSQPNAAERFLAEARRTFRLDHPNCVRATDAGVADGELLYLVMELLEGRTLGEELDNDGRIDPNRVAHIGSQVASAIGCAHDLGYVHRDLKPDNIMLLHRGADPDFVKVLDFGLAKLTDEAKLAGKHSVMSFTRNGMVFGTPHYMSPEQAQGHKLDPRSDIYSLGVVLYEALAGGPPFDSESEVEVLIAHVQTPPPRLTDYCDASPAFEELVMAMLAKRPEHRPRSAAEVADRLARVDNRVSTRVSGPRPSVAASETLALPEGVSAELEAVAAPPMPGPSSVAAVASADAPPATNQPANQRGGAMATAPTRAMTPSRPRPPSIVDHAPLPARRSPFLWIASALLLAALGVTIWAVTRKNNGEADRGASAGGGEAAIDAAMRTTDPAQAGAGLDAGSGEATNDAGAATDASVDAAATNDVTNDASHQKASTQTAAQRKAESLYHKAIEARRAGGSELSYLPKLQSAYRLDRKNGKIRRALIKALLGSRDAAQRSLGCKMIRRDKSRFKREGCAGVN